LRGKRPIGSEQGFGKFYQRFFKTAFFTWKEKK